MGLLDASPTVPDVNRIVDDMRPLFINLSLGRKGFNLVWTSSVCGLSNRFYKKNNITYEKWKKKKIRNWNSTLLKEKRKSKNVCHDETGT